MSDMSNTTITAKESSGNGLTMESSTKRQYSAISEHSSVKGTPKAIREWLMSLQQDSPVRDGQQRLEEQTNPVMIYGRKPSMQFKSSSQERFCLKTYKNKPLNALHPIYMRWVTLVKESNCKRQTWAQTTKGLGTGYVHTPTTKANYCANSMMKWESCRNYARVFGKPHPETDEYLMGMPAGWTDLEPLEMDKYQLWRQQHGIS